MVVLGGGAVSYERSTPVRRNQFHVGNGVRANRTTVGAVGLAASLERNSESEAFSAEAATAQVLLGKHLEFRVNGRLYGQTHFVDFS